MTENEKTLARALERCTFFPGIGTKRFARDMAFAAAMQEPPPLTPAQRRYLLTAVVRYRRQIAVDVVALAEAELQADAMADAAGAAAC